MIVALSHLEITDKTTQQKHELIKLYEKQTKNKLSLFSTYNEIYEKVKHSISNFENIVDKLQKEIQKGAKNDIVNGFELIAAVSSQFTFQLNAQTLVVNEYLSYEKIAKANHKAKVEANGKH